MKNWIHFEVLQLVAVPFGSRLVERMQCSERCPQALWALSAHNMTSSAMMEKCPKYSELTSHQNCRFSSNDNHKTDLLGTHTLACQMRSMLGHAMFASKMDSKRSLPCLPEQQQTSLRHCVTVACHGMPANMVWRSWGSRLRRDQVTLTSKWKWTFLDIHVCTMCTMCLSTWRGWHRIDLRRLGAWVGALQGGSKTAKSREIHPRQSCAQWIRQPLEIDTDKDKEKPHAACDFFSQQICLRRARSALRSSWSLHVLAVAEQMSKPHQDTLLFKIVWEHMWRTLEY